MNKKIIVFIGCFLIVIIGLAYILLEHENKNKLSKTEMIFFGLGKADSIFIRNGGENLLIDTGEKQHADLIIERLKGLGIRKIDYIILTHPDKDHIGGAAKIIDKFEVGKVFQSSFIKENKAEARLSKFVEEKRTDLVVLNSEKNFKVGNLDCTIYAAKKDSYKKSNDNSLVTLIKDGKLDHLFTGDMEEKRIAEFLKADIPKIDILKLPHHGRFNELSESLIEKTSPKFVFVTNNKDQVPQEMLDILRKTKAKVFYTNEKEIEITTDGQEINYD